MCEPRVGELNIGDKVRETAAYRKFARDREVRGEVKCVFGTLITVRNAGGWELSVHKDWLERDYDLQTYLTPGIFKSAKQKYCQHCGEKL
jgi:hypothetical protein